MKRLFGTDGIRGSAGAFPLDAATVRRIGHALALGLAEEAGRAPRLVLGRDTRESGPGIESALVEGVTRAGGRVDRGDVLTTPAVACLTRLLGYDGGVVISASHNPYRDNGIKVFSRTGCKLPDALEASIERRVLDGAVETADGPVAPGAAGAPPPAPAPGDPSGRTPETLRQRYLDWLAGALGTDTSLAGWRVVLDCAHGAASVLAPAAFRRLGAEVHALHDAPDGRNINAACGALHPDTLAAEVVARRAALGLAFDGDADRCVVVDATGRVLDGDHVLFLAARDLKAAGRLRGDSIVGTVMSNLWLERALRDEGIALRRAPVGDKYVLEEMQRGGQVLGGEQSGHVIFLERSTTGDGLLTGLWIVDLLRRTGLDLATWAASIRPSPQILVNVPVRERPPLDAHPVIGEAIRRETRTLGDRGRLLVRYSGTEAQVRIMVEAESRDQVEGCAARLRQVIAHAIGREEAP